MTDTTPLSKPLGQRIAFWLALTLVVVGMVNTLPEIPGLQDLARDLTGRPFFRVSNFPPEYFYPPVFLLMMLIVALDSSVYRAWRETRPNGTVRSSSGVAFTGPSCSGTTEGIGGSPPMRSLIEGLATMGHLQQPLPDPLATHHA